MKTLDELNKSQLIAIIHAATEERVEILLRVEKLEQLVDLVCESRSKLSRKIINTAMELQAER